MNAPPRQGVHKVTNQTRLGFVIVRGWRYQVDSYRTLHSSRLPRIKMSSSKLIQHVDIPTLISLSMFQHVSLGNTPDDASAPRLYEYLVTWRLGIHSWAAIGIRGQPYRDRDLGSSENTQ